jgi:hypothetical protein
LIFLINIIKIKDIFYIVDFLMKTKTLTVSTIIGFMLSFLYLFNGYSYFLSMELILDDMQGSLLTKLPTWTLTDSEYLLTKIATTPWDIEVNLLNKFLLISALVLFIIFLFSQIIDIINKSFSRKSLILWFIINVLLYFLFINIMQYLCWDFWNSPIWL